MTMPAGTYYIGDLCYIFHGDKEWDEVCQLTTSGHTCIEGVFTLKDGRVFSMYNTAYGDGTYGSSLGATFSVDSGSIGCILMSDIDFTDSENDTSGGFVMTFENDFSTQSESGTISFGELSIYTDPDPADEDEDEDQYGFDDEDSE